MRPNYDELIKDFGCTNVHLIPYYSRMFDFQNNDWFAGSKPYSHKSGTVRVKVGNSGWPINDHEASYETLRKFEREEIEVISPLTYGEEDYIENTIDLGKKTFGEKYVALVEMLEKREYSDFLSDGVDIMVYHSRAQTGLYNLYFGLYAGKKVFAKGYNYDWITSFGAKIHHVDEIEEMTFEQFREPLTSAEIAYNRKKLIEAVDVSVTLPKWKSVLGYSA
jgi:hypothetical protein